MKIREQMLLGIHSVRLAGEVMRAHLTAAAVRWRRLTYLDHRALVELYRATASLEVPGSVVEAGTALGGSAAMIAKALAEGRTLHLYDTFGMIPPPSPADGEDVQVRYRAIVSGESEGIGKGVYYGYQGDLRDQVRDTIDRFAPGVDVQLHPGAYEQTLFPAGPVALAHVDCDWYDSVRVCLERIWPELSPGGRVIIDDYYVWLGARRAVDEFIERHAVVVAEKSRRHLVKPQE